MFETIVWAADGAPGADRALDDVARLARRFGSSVRVVHIARRPSTPSYRAVCDDEDEVLERLRSHTATLRRRGVQASLHVIRGARGSPAQPIADTAAAVEADLVIVGSRRSPPAGGEPPGTLTRQLLGAVGCPVMALAPAREAGPASAGSAGPGLGEVGREVAGGDLGRRGPALEL